MDTLSTNNGGTIGIVGGGVQGSGIDICESSFHDIEDPSLVEKNFRTFNTSAGCYEFEVQHQQREYRDGYMLTKGECVYKDTTNEFVGVSSLDILQGVGQGKIL